MFSRNLRYYRLKNALSKKALAARLNLTPAVLSDYENGKRIPDVHLLESLADVLGATVTDFLVVRNDKLTFRHGKLSEDASLPAIRRDYVYEFIEEYFSRFMTVVEILGLGVLPPSPTTEVLSFTGDPEVNATSLRRHLGLFPTGPLDDLTRILESRGILLCVSNISYYGFSGLSGYVNDYPYIVVDRHLSPARTRFVIVRELFRLMFSRPIDMGNARFCRLIAASASAFLLPKEDLIRKLGTRRTVVAEDMLLAAQQYRVSMSSLLQRAQSLGIVSARLVKSFLATLSPELDEAGLSREAPVLFEQLVYRAVTEGKISMSRGAELLRIPTVVLRLKLSTFDDCVSDSLSL